MPADNITLTVDRDKSKVSISGVGSMDLVIEYSGDIDFTQLVDMLTECIDEGKTFSVIQTPESLDEKTALVIKTIRSIVDKFNEVVVASTADLEVAGAA